MDLTIAKDSAWRQARDEALQRDTLRHLRTVLQSLKSHFQALESATASLAQSDEDNGGAMTCSHAAFDGAEAELSEVRIFFLCFPFVSCCWKCHKSGIT
jgi:hypothetical protein